jgi:hypothetical protein
MLQRLPEFCVSRGSTPCLEVGMPLELENSDVIYATFAQDRSALLEYNLNGSADASTPAASGSMEIDEDDATILRICMTQADTLAFETGEVVLSIRIKRTDEEDTLADTLKPITGMVFPAIKEGVI